MTRDQIGAECKRKCEGKLLPPLRHVPAAFPDSSILRFRIPSNYWNISKILSDEGKRLLHRQIEDSSSRHQLRVMKMTFGGGGGGRREEGIWTVFD